MTREPRGFGARGTIEATHTPPPLHVGPESDDGVFGILQQSGRSIGIAMREEDAHLWAISPLLLYALIGMFALHEPEGRFQPSHFKPFLADARRAIAKALDIPESEVTALLAEKWNAATRQMES